MERRTFLTLLAGTPVLTLLASCGSDDVADPGAALPSVPDASPPVPDTLSGGTDDRGDARLEFGYYGGFTTREVSFQMQPSLLVADGKVFTPGPVAAIYPGALLPTDVVRSITPAGVEALMVAARDAGMFDQVSYDAESNIADASTATLVIDHDGQTYRHEAYALGAGGFPGDGSEQSPERQAFAAFAEQLTDLAKLVGAENLGPDETFVPDAYQVIAFPAGDLSGLDIEPTLVKWPTSTGVVLGDLADCVEVPRADVADLFESATQLTFFVEDGVTYGVVPRPVLPGRPCP